MLLIHGRRKKRAVARLERLPKDSTRLFCQQPPKFVVVVYLPQRTERAITNESQTNPTSDGEAKHRRRPQREREKNLDPTGQALSSTQNNLRSELFWLLRKLSFSLLYQSAICSDKRYIFSTMSALCLGPGGCLRVTCLGVLLGPAASQDRSANTKDLEIGTFNNSNQPVNRPKNGWKEKQRKNQTHSVITGICYPFFFIFFPSSTRVFLRMRNTQKCQL